MNPDWSAVLWGVLYANTHGVQGVNIAKIGLRKYAASGLILERIHGFLTDVIEGGDGRKSPILSETIARLMGWN